MAPRHATPRRPSCTPPRPRHRSTAPSIHAARVPDAWPLQRTHPLPAPQVAYPNAEGDVSGALALLEPPFKQGADAEDPPAVTALAAATKSEYAHFLGLVRATRPLPCTPGSPRPSASCTPLGTHCALVRSFTPPLPPPCARALHPLCSHSAPARGRTFAPSTINRMTVKTTTRTRTTS